MLRGLVRFSRAHIIELVKLLDKDKFKDSLLYIKVNSALNQVEDVIPIELSEDEVEVILDELEPDPNNVIRKALNEAMLNWRG